MKDADEEKWAEGRQQGMVIMDELGVGHRQR